MLAYNLAAISGLTAIGWALSPATGPAAPIFGTISGLGALGSVAASYLNPDPDDRVGLAYLQPFVEIVMPNGEVRRDDAFQPIGSPQLNTPFGLSSNGFEIYAGSKMARYVGLAAEVTVQASGVWTTHIEAYAHARLETDTNPQALSQFIVKTWQS